MKNKAKTLIVNGLDVGLVMNNNDTVDELKEEYGIDFNEFHVDEFTPYTLYKAPEIHPQPYICDLKIPKTSSTKRTSNKTVSKRRKRNKNKKTHR